MFPSKGSVENLFFCVIRLFSAAAKRVTSSLPRGGGSMWGASPYPLFWFDFSINLLMIIALWGDAQAAGAEAQCKKEPPRATACFSPGFQQSLS